MALPLEQFVKQLEDSGIIAAETLKDFIPPKANPKNAEELARELVVKKKLTKFQANEAYQGKAKSLRLGNYTLLDKIGAGGMGQVFKAEHRRMHRIVAIKMLPPALTKDAAALARFEREVTAAAKLEHPNIVAAYDADEARGVHFLVMQYVEGRDLSALVKKDGPFPVDKAVNYVLQAARGLEFAHKSGVIHRDIKPANLLLGTDGTVKILDMGLARIEAGGDAETQAELTGTGMVMGTVDYMAPEQGMNTKNADARADIYSLGCTLYYLLIGKAVYRGETVMAKMVAHLQEPIPYLCQLRNEVPLQVDTVFQKMVAKKIGDRYQTMTEVVADLEQCGVGRDVSMSGQHSLGLDNDEGLLTFLKDIPVGTTHKPRAAKAAAQGGIKNKKPLLIGAGVLGIIGLLLGVIISLRTKDGTLVVEVNQPDAVVQVLSEEGKVEISEPGGTKPISISVVPGKHRIRVEKDGFVAITNNIEIESGGTLDIKARLVPKAKPVASSGQQTAKPGETPADFQKWLQDVVKLTAFKQVEAVAKKLQELNPDFDGNLKPGFEGRVVTRLEFATDNVTDISPLQALVGLRTLNCSGSALGKSRLSDLSPLKGMPLTNLNCGGTQVTDLSPLAGMRLTYLLCGNSPVSDLSSLKGMPLRHLNCSSSHVSDLSPLQGMPLTNLDCYGTPVFDLSPLKGTPLAVLSCGSTKVSDLSPLAGMHLTNLYCYYTQVSDLSPLEGMNLIDVHFSPKRIAKGLDVVRHIKSVKTIGVGTGQPTWPADEFWKKYDAGEFGQPAVANQPWNTPAFQQWVKATQALPAEKQIEAVSKKLMELNPEFDGTMTGIHHSPTPKIENGVVTEFGLVTDKVTDISPVRALAGLKILKCVGDGPVKGRLSDFSPLTGMPLTGLWFNGTQVSDTSPLEGMNLTAIAFTPQNITKGLDVIRQMKSLKTIGLRGDRDKFSPEEFWKKYDAGEFGKPAAPTKLAYLDPAFQQWVKATQALPAEQQIEAVTKKLMELNPGFDGVVTGAAGIGKPKIESGVVTQLRFVTVDVTDISPVRALLGLKVLRCVGSGLAGGKSSNLSPLEGMPLTTLSVHDTLVSDLSPLASMLTLGSLDVRATKVTPAGVATLQKTLPNCKIDWDDPAKAATAQPNQPWNTPAFQAWMKEVAAMPAEKQIEAVSKKLMELNPGFDGKMIGPAFGGGGTPRIQKGAVTEIGFFTDNVTDISPVRALTGLKALGCTGGGSRQGKLSDLSPLDGMGLTMLVCYNTGVSDLSPLKQAKLTYLHCGRTQVSDLSPLQGMHLTYLACSHITISDLAPLKGMPLTLLSCTETQVSDLSPLRGMPLANVHFSYTKVGDLSPLQGMPLTDLRVDHTQVIDLSPLADCTSMKTLNINATKVTPAAVAALQKALPNCKIEWDDPATPKTIQPAASGTK